MVAPGFRLDERECAARDLAPMHCKRGRQGNVEENILNCTLDRKKEPRYI